MGRTTLKKSFMMAPSYSNDFGVGRRLVPPHPGPLLCGGGTTLPVLMKTPAAGLMPAPFNRHAANSCARGSGRKWPFSWIRGLGRKTKPVEKVRLKGQSTWKDPADAVFLSLANSILPLNNDEESIPILLGYRVAFQQ